MNFRAAAQQAIPQLAAPPVNRDQAAIPGAGSLLDANPRRTPRPVGVPPMMEQAPTVDQPPVQGLMKLSCKVARSR